MAPHKGCGGMVTQQQRRKREAPHAIVHSMAIEIQHTHTSDTTVPSQSYEQLTIEEFSAVATVSSQIIAQANSHFAALTYICERLKRTYPLLTSGECGSVTPLIASLLHESNIAQTASSNIRNGDIGGNAALRGWEPLVLLLQTQPSAPTSDRATPVFRKIMEIHALGFCDVISDSILIGALWKRNQVPGTLEPTHVETSKAIQHLLSTKRRIYALSLRRRKFGVLRFDNANDENTTWTAMCEQLAELPTKRSIRSTSIIPIFSNAKRNLYRMHIDWCPTDDVFPLSVAFLSQTPQFHRLSQTSRALVCTTVESVACTLNPGLPHMTRRAGTESTSDGASNQTRSHQRHRSLRVGFYANLLGDVVEKMDLDDDERASMVIDLAITPQSLPWEEQPVSVASVRLVLDQPGDRLIEALSVKQRESKESEKETEGAGTPVKFRKFTIEQGDDGKLRLYAEKRVRMRPAPREQGR
ncbi:uncharacterized protein EV422DRAFT_7555 [Fimicolochytrium jonesii]|uniref:uncharacterized protein n=1 Tax=Fimicolochytrium jonesii TaxID=1396493 RepID=UPI0022FDD748|nr:uncharacterized protein EV422DRAFT_7555 [Fimicolochytrium jonesii]KAI8826718.1 hypothetical protein EV422DRAFT_7555 [Fimicolochytrium jonesii]